MSRATATEGGSRAYSAGSVRNLPGCPHPRTRRLPRG